MISRQHIFDSFDGYFSKKAIQLFDADENWHGEWRLVGKFGQIVPLEDGNWDLFIGPDSTQRSLTRRLSFLPQEWPFHKLDGEAWVQVPLEGIKSRSALVARVLGIRRKRKVTLTEEQLEVLRERAKGWHENEPTEI